MGAAPKQELDELFNAADFDSIKIYVEIFNQTSKTSVGGETRGFGEQVFVGDQNESVVLLMEFRQMGVVLDVPERVAAPGHVLDVLLEVRGVPLPPQFKVRGKVSALVPLEGGRERLELELLEFNQRFYETLQAVFKKRQDEIDAFLSGMRR